MTDEQFRSAVDRIENLARYLRVAAPVMGQQRADAFDDAAAIENVLAALRERDRRIEELEAAVRWALDEGETFTDAGRTELRRRAFPAATLPEQSQTT